MRLILLFVLCAAGAAAESPFAWKDVDNRSLQLTEHGRPVLTYNYGLMEPKGVPKDRHRCCYVHPVYTPGNIAVTDDFPKDHYHHRGIFWAWPVVKVDGKEYDAWLLDGIRQIASRFIAQEATEDFARLGVENSWYTKNGHVMRETVEITVPRRPDGDRRDILFTLRFEALGRPVELRGEPTQNKGYGGFSVRFAPRENTEITTELGREQDANMDRRQWAALEGDFQGGRAGLRVEVSPRNPGFPNGWCLRHYGFLGVNFPGLESYVLKPGEPLTLRYRVQVYDVR